MCDTVEPLNNGHVGTHHFTFIEKWSSFQTLNMYNILVQWKRNLKVCPSRDLFFIMSFIGSAHYWRFYWIIPGSRSYNNFERQKNK